MESDPAFKETLEELREVIAQREHSDGIAAAIIEELNLLEHDIAMRSAHLKELAGKLESGQ